MSNLFLGAAKSRQRRQNTLVTRRIPQVSKGTTVDLIDLSQDLEVPAVLSRHSFLSAIPALPMQIVVEDDDGDFCIEVSHSDDDDDEVPNSAADNGNGSAPVIAVEVEDNAQVDPLPHAVAVQSAPSRINDENTPLGPLGPLGTLDPHCGEGDNAELGIQQEWIPPRVVPEARCCLMNADGLCAKCVGDTDPEDVPRHLLPSGYLCPGKPDIEDRCETAEDVQRTTHLHSYHQACGCQQLYKKSGSKRKIFVCTTADKEEIDGEPKITECAYKAVWRLRTRGGTKYWVLDRKNSHLQHAIGCQSKRRMTTNMLMKNPKFAGSIINRDKTTIKQLMRDGLTPGVTNNTLTKRILYRARDRLLCHLASDYEHHFDWMETWAKIFCDHNDGSAYHIDKDEDGR